MAGDTSAPVGVSLAARPAARGVGGVRRLLHRRSTVAFLMSLPLLVLIGGLVVYPAFYAVYLSMLNRHMTAFEALLGFIIAHLLHAVPGQRQRVLRGLLLIPWVLPLALSTLTWWWLFDPSYSAFNWVLTHLGFRPVPWLGDGWIARFCTIAVNVWYGTPFFMVMYLAALKSVPEQLYEAADVDGASGPQKLVHITLPMLRNIIALTVLFSLIVTFADFDIVRILTSGGPQDMTHVFATYAFQVGIQSGDIPLGAAVSLFMLPILAVSAFVVLRGVSRRSREMAL